VATFNLSEGERQFLISADKGQCLLSAGTQGVAFQSLASPQENALIATDPAELARFADLDSSADDGVVDLGVDDTACRRGADSDGHINLDIAA